MTRRELEMIEMDSKLESLMDEVYKDYYSEIGNSQLEEVTQMYDMLAKEESIEVDERAFNIRGAVLKMAQ